MSVYTIGRLHQTLVNAGIPLLGVSATGPADVRVQYAAAATAAQRASGAAILAAFDWSATADLAFRDQQEPDLVALRDSAAAAVTSNNTYLAILTPTNAQVVAQVRALSQQQNGIIKALARLAVRSVG